MYSGYGIVFDEADEWNFGNDFARNVVIFGFDNNSSSHTDNRKINSIILDEGDIFHINGSFSALVKTFSINFSKAKTKVCLGLYYNHGNSYLFVNKKRSISLKPIIKMLTFQLNFV